MRSHRPSARSRSRPGRAAALFAAAVSARTVGVVVVVRLTHDARTTDRPTDRTLGSTEQRSGAVVRSFVRSFVRTVLVR